MLSGFELYPRSVPLEKVRQRKKLFIVNEIRRTAWKIKSCIVLKDAIAKNFVVNEHHSFTFVFTFSGVVVDLPADCILSFLFPTETDVLVPVFSHSTDVVVVNFVVVLKFPIRQLNIETFSGRRQLQSDVTSSFVGYCACSCSPPSRRAPVGDVNWSVWRCGENVSI